ncbi:tetratricopeptide repeat protein [Lutibacter sp. TH_r2]|uniref:tetratricopeptide repeat protein n=1 Tax=Lutibacter sp. TH_r2 TaxID=3082083 RepID=UPI0029559DDF|nr:tetratricopeptide repeat protein [Lutibacter sp. TH_r2]MDV7186031.1 tetratricopeptide repeat protein [Lutibacter sp. TH_r2]
MKNIENYYLFVFFMLFVNLSIGQENNNLQEIHKKAMSLRFSQPDSAAFYFDKGYQLSLKNKDTLESINYLLELSQLYSHNVNYGKSYDGYWQALLLADKSNDLVSKSNIYQGLGWLYSFYQREDEALKYFYKSINIRKELLKNDNSDLNRDFLQSDYFSVLNLYRVNKDYATAKMYLDSCILMRKQSKLELRTDYLVPEEGLLYAIDGNFKKALENLNKAKKYFEENDPSYLVIVHSLLGNVYRLMDLPYKSIENHKKSLEISKELNRHINYRIFGYEALSEIYYELNKPKEAYKYLKLAKERNDEIFGGQSKNNTHLLEIKDKYRIEKDKQNDLIKQKHIAELEHEEKVSLLQNVILVGVLVFILLYGFVWVKHIRNKYKSEKRILTEKQKLRLQKQNEILELKNKELTESALRLIEKDEFIASMKKKLSNNNDEIDINVVKRMLKSIQGTPNSNWKEFEARFTTINQSFYKKLKENFPQLSQTDQKICALVKLNFSSKDMSKLLGISVESVHTSRYRLRKKLELNRNDNLEEFINKF